METRSLLYGLIGFIIGGFIVSLAATTMQPANKTEDNPHAEMSMTDMTESLRDKTGDEYDKAFISYMIEHHESAVDMARLSANNAKHQEIKDLSNAIITAQESEINEMKQWQREWRY